MRMNILAIETSCDETAVSIVSANGDFSNASFHVHGDQLLSQIAIHTKYGGVYPMLAKREHSKNLIPLFEEVLKEAGMYQCTGPIPSPIPKNPDVEKILEREPELLEQFLRLFAVLLKPRIDCLAVTEGPGLEPALWVGINFARALAHTWDLPLIPVNHVKGHIFSALLEKKEEKEFSLSDVYFPVLALSIAGGHTELVLMKNWGEYEVVGETRDDAVGEAFDKVARMLDLPYPGGPEISRLAESAREGKALAGTLPEFTLPRPMIDTDDFNFSFSGLKTAVLYRLKKIPELTNEIKQAVALEFENAVTDVLLKKTTRALEHYGARTVVIEGGVSANQNIRRVFKETINAKFPQVTLRVPERKLSTDNAIMIAVAGYYRWLTRDKNPLPSQNSIKANGTLRL